MAALLDEQKQYTDQLTGELINAGYIYVGAQNLDPRLNTITIYSDRDLLVPIVNPQRTGSDGRAVNKIWVESEYSIAVYDTNDVQKYINLDNGNEDAYTNAELDAKDEDIYSRGLPYPVLSNLQGDADNVTVGYSYKIDERTTGNGGGAWWKAIAKTTENGWNIVTGNATVSFQLALTFPLEIETLGGIGDGGFDGTGTDNAGVSNHAVGLTDGGIIYRAGLDYAMGSTVTLPGAPADRGITLRSNSERKHARFTALTGFTGVIVQNNGGGIDGIDFAGSDISVVGHKGIQLGDATYWNPSVKLHNIRFYGGLYDGVYTAYEHDNADIDTIHCFDEVGRAVMYMDATASHAPSGAPEYKRLFFRNPEGHSPAAGDQKKIGLFESRADGLRVSGIINNYDRCLDLGENDKLYNSNLKGLHCEERRTIMDVGGSGMPWVATTAKALDAYAAPTIANANGHFYIVTTAGTTGGTEPTWPTASGGTVIDGTVTWTEVGESIGVRAHKCDQLDISCLWLDQHLACVSLTNPIRLDLSVFKIDTDWGCSIYARVSTISPVSIAVRNGVLKGTLTLNAGTTDVPYIGEFVEVLNNANTIVPDHKNGRFSIYEEAFPSPVPVLETAVSLITDFNIHEVINVDATGSNRTITVSGSARFYGRKLTVCKIDSSANTVTVVLSGKTFVGGGTSVVLANQGDTIELLYLADPIKLNVYP